MQSFFPIFLSRWFIPLLCLLTAPLIAQQEICGSNGGFTVLPEAGCAPLTVTVTNTVPDGTDIRYHYDFKEGASGPQPGTALTSHTYTLPGEYTILQTGNNGADFTFCRQITVIDNSPPNYRLITCNNGSVQLELIPDEQLERYETFTIDWGDGGPVQSLSGADTAITHAYDRDGSYTLSVSGIFASGPCAESRPNRQTVRIRRTPDPELLINGLQLNFNAPALVTYTGLGPDFSSGVWTKPPDGPFTETGVSVDGEKRELILVLQDQEVFTIKFVSDYCGKALESNPVTTMILKAASENEQNRISWNEYPAQSGFERYEVYRDDRLLTTIRNREQLDYVDTDVTCGVIYQYQVRAYTQQAFSNSATRAVTGRSEVIPSPVTGLYCTVQHDSAIYLSGEMPFTAYTDNYRLTIERSVGNGPFEPFEVKTVTAATSQRQSLVDERVDASRLSYCYRMLYENACENRSEPSQPVCSVLLQQAGKELQWNTATPFLSEIDGYELYLDNSPHEAFGPGIHGFLPDQDFLKGPTPFRLLIRDKTGSWMSESNFVTFTPEARFLVPTAFTPNQDGHNDDFQVKGLFLQAFKMTIFNQWGEVVHYTEDGTQGWDGTVKGHPAPSGSYAYELEATDPTGKNVVKKGTFLLIR